MNVYVFWILFFGLWGIVPLMIIKGRTDEKKIKTVPEVKTIATGWINAGELEDYISRLANS